jgi:hypothetical protein
MGGLPASSSRRSEERTPVEPRQPPEGNRKQPIAHVARGRMTIRVGYLAVGIVMGGLWAWNAGEPVVQHGLKMMTIAVIIPTLFSRLRDRRLKRVGQQRTRQTLSLPRLIAARLILIGVALVAHVVLEGYTDETDYLIALGLLVIPPLVGPIVHNHLLAPTLAVGPSLEETEPDASDSESPLPVPAVSTEGGSGSAIEPVEAPN